MQLSTPIKKLTLFGHFALGKLATKEGDGLPFIVWPDGSPCNPANLYMLALRDRPGRGGSRGLSRRGSRGGSIGDYAFKIGPLIRYCFKAKLDFIKLDDQHFSDFIDKLRSEVSPKNPAVKRRTESSILAIGRVCLGFLQFIGRYHGENDFVSEHGSIKAVTKSVSRQSESSKVITSTYLHHHSLHATGTRTHTRNPITAENIKKLRDAVGSIESSRHLQLRRNLMLSLLEHTGARRLEIAGLTIDDIKAAKALAEPMLRLETLKRSEKSERFIPISKVVLSEANKYIETARKKSMRSFKGSQDHRALFVQEITGKKLSEHSITREMSILREHAKIEEQACAHMFRHAFITNLFVLLIKRYNFSNTSEFRNAFLHSKQFIAEVMLWTGHKNPASVERYIHLAFAQIDGYEETVSSVHMIRINRIYDQAEAELLEKLVGGMPATQYALELGEMKRLRKEDLQHAQTQEQANEAAETASLDL